MQSDNITYRVIGAMSGTSLDGLDLAYCIFNLINGVWSFSIEAANTIPYSKRWSHLLKQAELKSDWSEIDDESGRYIAARVNQFILQHRIKDVDLIASHGHTLFHEPQRGITVQVGNGEIIKELTGIKTISNFRQQDVKLGGQGAPLVPIGDLHLFRDYEICLNIGGFANLSLKSEGTISAWDVCPVNFVLNKLSMDIGLPYDDRGQIASSNMVDIELFNRLNELEYYELNPPKSLAREWVEEHVWPILNSCSSSTEVKIATFTQHAAYQISTSINKKSNVLITGGGAYNDYLISCIQKFNTSAKILLPNSDLVEFKEALIFAFLGVLRIRDEVNVLASVTGASRNHSSGDIFQ